MCELHKLAARVQFFVQRQMGQKVTARGKQQEEEEDVEYLVHYDLDCRDHSVQMSCTCDIFSILMMILLLYVE
jgi:hypothetical protein